MKHPSFKLFLTQLSLVWFLAGLLVFPMPVSKAIRLDETTWYLQTTSASSAFGTTGPTQEYSTASDLDATSPTSKTTALAMTATPGTAEASVAGTETSLIAGALWLRTFLSPKLAAQTIPTGTTFRFEGALAETLLSANMIFRIHVYLWREGSGYVSSFSDGVALTSCGAEPAAINSSRSQVCVTTATLADVSVNAGDQIAFEVWVHANNVSSTSFTGTMYFGGDTFIGDGTASHVVSDAMSSLTVNRELDLYNNSDITTVWFLSGTSAASAFGRDGPTAEYSSAADDIPATPSTKGTAKSMWDTVGTSQSSLTFTESSIVTQKVWMGTFLSPLLEAQTLPAGTTFRYEGSLLENGTPANMFTRLHIYLWREGTGYVSSVFDGVAATDCDGEAGITQRSMVCVTAGLGSDLTVLAGDQLAFELWVFANNTSTTGYSATAYYGGSEIIENGVSGHNVTSSRTAVTASAVINLLTTTGVDIVDSNGDSVASPGVTFVTGTYSPLAQTTTATLGASSAKLRVETWGASNTWTLSLAPTSGATAYWSNASNRKYDFNDAGTGLDGADADSFGGRLTVDASGSTVAAAYGCSSTTGLTKGSSSSFAEGSVDSVSLLIAGSSASYNCAWDLTGVSLSQVIPGYQGGGGAYSLGMTLSIL